MATSTTPDACLVLTSGARNERDLSCCTHVVVVCSLIAPDAAAFLRHESFLVVNATRRVMEVEAEHIKLMKQDFT